MTVNRSRIACKEPEFPLTATGPAHTESVTAREVRAWAADHGWTIDLAGKDFCPDHSYGG